jgi:hypothetical protein
MIKVYTTHCPKCQVLEMKLKQKKIEFESCDDMDEMTSRGIKAAPSMEVDGTIYNFTDAVKWVNAQ